MLIAIVGTRASGRSTVEEYFVSVKGFTSVQIAEVNVDLPEPLKLASTRADTSKLSHSLNTPGDDSGLEASVKSLQLPSSNITPSRQLFTSGQQLLLHVTKNWQEHFVTLDLRSRYLVELFIRRPFFVLISIDAPLYKRFLRSKCVSLTEFVQDHDYTVFGSREPSLDLPPQPSPLHALDDLVDIQVDNSFQTISDLYRYIEGLNLLNPEFLRPGWDAYFMTLATLASQRSNCMKRRVGAVLVRDNRVVSTGYNGTPRGLPNCDQGGCPRCNGISTTECLCLHAEENALLEVGRERVGTSAVLYCNTCPCLRCTVKIIQTGVKTVVYNLSYKVDDASASLFQQAGVKLRRYSIHKSSRLLGGLSVTQNLCSLGEGQ